VEFKIKNPQQRFCSVECRRKWTHRVSKMHSRNRKAIRKNTWDGVPDEALYERDGWLCQMPVCFGASRTIDPELPNPTPWSKSIDHVLPLSRGGLDTSGNKRAAHLRCNISRSNTLDDEDFPPPEALPARPKPVKQPKPPRVPRFCRVCRKECLPPRRSACSDDCARILNIAVQLARYHGETVDHTLQTQRCGRKTWLRG
jgi:predicted nucleic acid-binding Zn ribbon protein